MGITKTITVNHFMSYCIMILNCEYIVNITGIEFIQL